MRRHARSLPFLALVVPTPWHATPRATWEALTKSEGMATERHPMVQATVNQAAVSRSPSTIS